MLSTAVTYPEMSEPGARVELVADRKEPARQTATSTGRRWLR